MDLETKEKLEDFLDEARRKSHVPDNLSITQVKTHIARFQNEILQFLDHTFTYLEKNNPSTRNLILYFPRSHVGELLKSYLTTNPNIDKYLPRTKQLLVAFHGDIKRNGYAVSRIDSKVKHERLHDIGTEAIVTFDLTNMSNIPDDKFVQRLPDGGTSIGGFMRFGPNAQADISNSVFVGPNGAVVVNKFTQDQKSNNCIIFKDGTTAPFQLWSNDCIKTCEKIFDRIK